MLIAVAVCFLFGCQKELGSGADLGNNNGADTTANACESYFPLTSGSTWMYQQPGGTQVDTVITPDTIIQGKTFKRVREDIAGISKDNFYREENGNIYAFIDFSTTVAATSQALVNPLRSNAPAGARWRDTIVLNASIARFEYEMIEKNVGHQVDSLYFTHVQHVQYKVRLDLPPVFADELVQITDVWYANCIGLIETKSQLLTSSLIVGSPNKIKSYSIK